MLIFSIDQVTVIKNAAGNALSIIAEGTASTPGWTNPHLDDSADPDPEDAVLELQFKAQRPTGIVAQVLVPITASKNISIDKSIDAVIVSSRTNSITVHASQFQQEQSNQPRLFQPDPGLSTAPWFEEGGRLPITTIPLSEEDPTTLRIGEEGIVTTQRIGEETPITKPWPLPEEILTNPLGEFVPITSPVRDDPRPPFQADPGLINPGTINPGSFGHF